uniref:Reverse transcriptase zinc-binding domain-containing protein n=1 Tax=Fagus sylvatica TaxID=28930 RepID=A0A2N9I5R3_FAGSY
MSITIPVVETNAAPDKLIWPHSLNGDYQVKKAYEILTHNDNVSEPPSPNNTHLTMWKHLWKIKLPQKILTFTWKILNHALPVKVELNRRGVHCNRDCLMCNNAIETQDHLFLHCELARAVWFGAGIPILHITQAEITVDIYGFLQNYSNNAGNTGRAGHTAKIATWTPDSNWQALITIAVGAITTSTRYGIAYMGKRRNGQVIFVGCKTTGSQDSKIARLLAIRESILTATKLGFQRLIIFTEDREIEHMWERNHLYRWKLSTIFQDIKNLQHQHHLSLTIKATPMAVIKETKSMALTASRTFLDVYHEHSMFGPYAFK